jgi:hypothetical protein
MLRGEPVTVICILISIRSSLAHTVPMQITIPKLVTCQILPNPLLNKKVAGFDSTDDTWICAPYLEFRLVRQRHASFYASRHPNRMQERQAANGVQGAVRDRPAGAAGLL